MTVLFLLYSFADHVVKCILLIVPCLVTLRHSVAVQDFFRSTLLAVGWANVDSVYLDASLHSFTAPLQSLRPSLAPAGTVGPKRGTVLIL